MMRVEGEQEKERAPAAERGATMQVMDQTTVEKYILNSFEGVETTTAFGYTMFFYRSDHRLPFATMISSDTDYDRASNLNRPGVYRLNIGVGKRTFQSLFGKGKIDVDIYDFTALDVILPHPDYSSQNFVCVLSPTDATFQRVRPLLAEAYEISVRRYKGSDKST